MAAKHNKGVSDALGHDFAKPALLEVALTHRSYSNENRAKAPDDNERLEFLGDSVLGAIVSTMLFEAFPDAKEGELTQRRAALVREEELASIALDLGLDKALRLGKGEAQSGGREKPRLLASALEACVGAVYLDGGYLAARAVLGQVFAERLHAREPGARDYKSPLQEWLQARGRPTPSYVLERTEGPDHDRHFFVEIFIGDERVGTGDGRSKLEAEQQAAEKALELLRYTENA